MAKYFGPFKLYENNKFTDTNPKPFRGFRNMDQNTYVSCFSNGYEYYYPINIGLRIFLKEFHEKVDKQQEQIDKQQKQIDSLLAILQKYETSDVIYVIQNEKIKVNPFNSISK